MIDVEKLTTEDLIVRRADAWLLTWAERNGGFLYARTDTALPSITFAGTEEELDAEDAS